MRNLKIKAYNSMTIANQLAALGQTPSGAWIFEVRDIPAGITNTQVLLHYQGYFGYRQNLSVQYHV